VRCISKFKPSFIGAAGVSLLSSVALAQPNSGLQPSLYAGVDYQHSSIVWEDFHLPTTPPTTINGGDLFAESFSGAHVHIGSRFGSNFGVELGYVWLPAVEKTIGGGNMSSLKVQGVTLDAMGYLPIDAMGRFEVIGLIGGAWLEGTAKLNGPSFGTNTDVDPDWSWRGGGGAQYRLSTNVNIRGLVIYQAARFDGEVDHALNVNVGLNFLFD
jgi:opacity protein-like surface antigen